MVEKIKSKIKKSKFLGAIMIKLYRIARSIVRTPKEYKLYKKTKKAILAERISKRIYYLGVPVHSNLGDQAQGCCIRKWIKKHYGDRELICIETESLVNTKFSAIKHLKKMYNQEDIIVFQSGYTTTDLGGYADEMHCKVILALPKANFLMMPQTIFFEREERKQNTSRVYDTATNMLFLARDRVSFSMAQEMFKSIELMQYPDIVTTLIGQYNYEYERDGILFCCRDDGEKYYSDEEIKGLMERCSEFAKTDITDTTKGSADVARNAESYIMKEIDSYSKYKVIITDRYHGTIFSLVAGTPVIIIRTTDHKVTTGAEWFKGIYDSHVFLANSLDEAYEISKSICAREDYYKLDPYFEKEYYDKLPTIYEEKITRKGK